jgi:hypothetical protein
LKPTLGAPPDLSPATLSQLTSLTRLALWDQYFLSVPDLFALQPSFALRHLELCIISQGLIHLGTSLTYMSQLQALHLDAPDVPEMLEALQQLSGLKVGAMAGNVCEHLSVPSAAASAAHSGCR